MVKNRCLSLISLLKAVHVPSFPQDFCERICNSDDACVLQIVLHIFDDIDIFIFLGIADVIKAEAGERCILGTKGKWLDDRRREIAADDKARWA